MSVVYHRARKITRYFFLQHDLLTFFEAHFAYDRATISIIKRAQGYGIQPRK